MNQELLFWGMNALITTVLCLFLYVWGFEDGVNVFVAGFVQAVFVKVVFVFVQRYITGGNEHHFGLIVAIQLVTVFCFCLLSAAKSGDELVN